jgi:PncC family amidohydrolase
VRPLLDLTKLRSITPKDYGIRFAFGFFISVVSAGATDLAGPRVGGLFLAFPAILPATLTLVERKEGIAQATSDVRGATLGAIGMIAFACVVAALVRRSPALALVAALLAWVVVSALAYLLIRGLVHLLGEKQYLPEISTSEAAQLIGVLVEQRLTIATAESCSGGMVAALLSSVPNTGEVFRGGLVAYTDTLKEALLGVPLATLRRHGAISGAAAGAMAAGARQATAADVAIAVTGSTGSASDGKPPGLTFIAVATRDVMRVRRFDGDLGPGRNDERAVRSALQLALAVLTGAADDELPGKPSAVLGADDA